MATKLYLRSVGTTRGIGWNGLQGYGPVQGLLSNAPTALRTLLDVQGPGLSSSNTNTVVGTTSGIPLLSSMFISPPVSAAVTIAGTITYNIWASESSMNANAGLRVLVFKIAGLDGALTAIASSNQGVELGTTIAAQNWTSSPASTALAKGDRIGVVVSMIDAGGTLASGFTVALGYDGATTGSNGDSYVQVTETVSFISVSADPSGSKYFFLNAASPVTGTGNKDMSTTAGSSSTNSVTNVTAGFMSPQQITDTGGGNNLTWYSPPLNAFTLSGAILANIRAKIGSTIAQFHSVGLEVAVVDGDGSNASVWGFFCQLCAGPAIDTNLIASVMDTTDRNYLVWVSGADKSVTTGQRLRFRILWDDPASGGNGATTGTISYNGNTGGSAGDTFVLLSQTVTEAGPGPKAITPAQVTAASTVSGDIDRKIRLVIDNISATSTVSGNVATKHLIKPTTNILATSTVSGAVSRAKPITPTTNVLATSTVTASASAVRALRKIAPAQISATSTMSHGSIPVKRAIRPSGDLVGPSIIDTFNDPSAPQLLTSYDPTNYDVAPYFDISNGGMSTQGSNQMGPSSAINRANYRKDISVADIELRMDVPVKPDVPSGGYAHFLFRFQNPTSGTSPNVYWFRIDNAGNYFFRSLVNGGTVSSSSGSQSWSAGDTFRCRAVGSTITVDFRTGAGPWTTIISTTNTDVVGAGTVGFYTTDATTRFANLAAGAVTTAAGGITAQSSLSGNIRALRKVVPAQISATSTISGNVVAKRAIRPTTNILATSTLSGTVTKGGGVKAITPTTNILATSTVTGNVAAQKKITGAAINATSTVSGDIIVKIAIAPTTNILATSTVSANVRTLHKIVPTTNILATSTVSGSIVARRGIIPTQISATSTVSGSVQLKRILPAQISATSTFSGTVTKTTGGAKAITPTTNILATSTLSGVTRALRKIAPAQITALSFVGGSIGRAVKVVPTTNILATSTLSGNVIAFKKITGGVINATSTVSGNVRALKKITGANIAATSTVSGDTRALRKIAPVQITAQSTVSGSIFKGGQKLITPTTNILATSTLNGSVAKRFRVVTTQISATSTLSANVAALRKIFPTQISATSTVSAGIITRRAVLPTQINATSTLAGSIIVKRGIIPAQITAQSTVSGNVKTIHLIRPTTNITAQSTFSGSMTTQPIKQIVPSSVIIATSTVSGKINMKYRLVVAQVTAQSTITGFVGVRRGVLGAAINATSTLSGIVGKRFRVITAQINATSTFSGVVTPAKAILPAQITAQSTVSATTKAFRAVRPAQISAQSTVTGSVATKHLIRPTTNITAQSTLSGSVVTKPVVPIFPAVIIVTSTFSGSINVKYRLFPAQISATSTVSGNVRVRRGIIGAVVNATSTISATVSTIHKIVPTTNISATSTLSGSVKIARRILPAQINGTTTLSGTIVVRRGIIPTQITAQSTVSGVTKALRAIRPAQINAQSSVTAGTAAVKPIIPATIQAVSSMSGLIRKTEKIFPAVINGTSTMSGVIHKTQKVFASNILAQSTVSGLALRVKRAIRPLVIHAQSSFSGQAIAVNSIIVVEIQARAHWSTFRYGQHWSYRAWKHTASMEREMMLT